MQFRSPKARWIEISVSEPNPKTSKIRPLELAASFTRDGRLLCRFLDAGMMGRSARCGGRRPKSAKARSRGKFGIGGAAGAMGI